MSSEWVPIRYREFYDIPRMVVVEFRGKLFLLDCPFDSFTDDYSEDFDVYTLPRSAIATVESPSWQGLPALGKALGRIPTASITFDPTKRRAITKNALERINS